MSAGHWPLGFDNSALVEEQYDHFVRNAASVLPSWRYLFQNLPEPKPPVRQPQKALDLSIPDLIRAYRTYGHLLADINPIATHAIDEPAELRLESFGLSKADLERELPTGGLLGKERASLSQLLTALRAIYCQKIGFEYMGVENPELELWLQNQIEPKLDRIQLSIDQKRMILQQLNRSELFELFLHKNFTGQKRFSLEGAETLIPMLSAIVEQGTHLGCEEFVLGMSHRGRLNVLSNILNKSHSEIFSEFEEGHLPDSFEGSGDVKYHKGFASEVQTSQGKAVRISLTPNPSHLESVYPVVEGQVRAKQVKHGDGNQSQDIILPVVIHGDAALAGQGIVYETMQMCGLAGYGNGGTLHIVVNNQIGFTTLPKDARSTRYCSDIARAFSAPVFHVNAEYPEDCVYATALAVRLRHRFHCDVFIDLNCYRKYGHNETDEPAFTQPIEYQLIRKKKPIRDLYLAQLIHQGVLERKVAEALEADFEKALHEAKSVKSQQKTRPSLEVERTEERFINVKTAVPKETLVAITERFCTVPNEFHLHPKLQHLLKMRLDMVHGMNPIDWGMAEHLALGSLLWEGSHVRLSGQDTRRGTFSHRHAMWMDQMAEKKYFPLSRLKEGQGRFDVFNSPLSEYAALGFEFGYSVSYPEALVIWEAQFGDFCNGGQVIIDQYISTAEQKWGTKFRLVLLLPHGYEGQGPEHSSARMERFLALCGQDNMDVVYPTLPSQMFHLLRRQLLKHVRKPLIVFTPKGLLRHPACVSTMEELTEGGFCEILDDPQHPKAKELVFCTGRIFYDLIAERDKRQATDIAIVRIEQLYPLHELKLREIINRYASATRFVWAQEEPSNMGAWGFIRPQLEKLLGEGAVIEYIGRERSASPATGSYKRHAQEHEAILQALFG